MNPLTLRHNDTVLVIHKGLVISSQENISGTYPTKTAIAAIACTYLKKKSDIKFYALIGLIAIVISVIVFVKVKTKLPVI